MSLFDFFLEMMNGGEELNMKKTSVNREFDKNVNVTFSSRAT